MLCLSLLIVGIDGTIVNVALPTLVRDIGATSSELQWIVDAYTIVFASLLLIAGNTGVAIGPLAGGYQLEHYRWGSIFLVNVGGRAR